MTNRKYLKKRKNAGIPDIEIIKKQYETGISIRSLSNYWNIPYATLYRALKPKKKK